MIVKLIATYKAVKAFYAFLKEMDQKGTKRFSDEWAQALRNKIIDVWLPKMKAMCGKGIFARIETDDKMHRCMQIIMKSDRLSH